MSDNKPQAQQATKSVERRYKVVHGNVVVPHGDVLDQATGRRELTTYRLGEFVKLHEDDAKGALKANLIELAD
jgi:hypothetical protein